MQMNTALSKLQDLSNIENVVELNSLILENSKLKESLHKHSINAIPTIKKLLYNTISIDLFYNLVLLIYQSIKPGILNRQKIFGEFTEPFLLISQSNFINEFNIFLINLTKKCKIFGGYLNKMVFNKTYQNGFIYFGDEIKIVFNKEVFRVRYISIIEIEIYDQLIIIILKNNKIEIEPNFKYTDKLFEILANKILISNYCRKNKKEILHKVMESTSETITISSPLNDICMMNNIKSRNKNSQLEVEGCMSNEEVSSLEEKGNFPLVESNKQESCSKLKNNLRSKLSRGNLENKINAKKINKKNQLENKSENKSENKPENKPENKKNKSNRKKLKNKETKLTRDISEKKSEKNDTVKEKKLLKNKIETKLKNPEQKVVENIKSLENYNCLENIKLIRNNKSQENIVIINNSNELSNEQFEPPKINLSSTTEKMIEEISNYTTLNDAELISNSTFKSVKILENINLSAKTSKESSQKVFNSGLKRIAFKILKNKVKLINRIKKMIIKKEKRKLKKILKEIEKLKK